MITFDINTYAVTPGRHSLSASAGTGKTFSLVGLILRQVVEEGRRLPEILAVTFTKKATGELSERLRKKLTEAAVLLADDAAPASSDPQLGHWQKVLAADPTKLPTYLTRIRTALAEADNAAVFTIHGFCQRVLTECAFESGLALDLDMEDAGAGFTRTAIRDFIRELYTPLATAGSPHAATARFIFEELGVTEKWLAELAKHLASGAIVTTTDFDTTFGPKVKAGAQLTAFYTNRNTMLAAYRTNTAISHDTLRITLANLITHIPGAAADTQKKKAAKSLVDFVALNFAAQLAGKLTAIKSAVGALTFDDLIGKTAEALANQNTGDRLAEQLRTRYKIALIDEFQDTDAKQTEIFQKIFTGLPLLFIGDAKQSIYRFRGADLAAYSAAVTTGEVCHAQLDTNFRSTPEVVAATNALFKHDGELSKRSPFPSPPETPDAPRSPLVFSPVLAGSKSARPLLTADNQPVTAMTLVWTEGATAETPVKTSTAEIRFARDLAARIAEMLRDHTLDGKPVIASDIAVLVRTKKQGAAVQNALRAAGVPASRTAGSVFDDAAAEAFRRLLAALLTPRRPSILRAALAGPIVGHDAKGIRELDADDAAYQAWADSFATSFVVWEKSGVTAAVTGLLNRHELPAAILARADGERLLADLRQLLELANAEERAAHRSPESLLGWLDAQIHAAGDEAQSHEANRQRLESDRDCVTIMTMHASKGLEFPVVFVPFAWKFGNGGPNAPKFVSASSAGVRQVAVKGHHDMLEVSEDSELHEEQARLLYVAVTRAKSACFLYSGLIANKSINAGIWETPLGKLGPVTIGGIRKKPKSGQTVGELVPCTARADWEKFAENPKTCFRVVTCIQKSVTVDADESPAFPRAGHCEVTPVARAFTTTIDRARISASYSGISRALEEVAGHAARPVPAAVSHRHDELLVPGGHTHAAALTAPAEPRAAQARAVDSIHTFPRGATVGDALHGFLEEHDFTQPAPAEAVAGALKYNGLDAVRWAEILRERIDAWLATPLTDANGGTFALRDILPGDRLPEMGFDLRAKFTEGAPLADALAGATSPRMPDSLLEDLRTAKLPELDGYLTGFIDLIFRRDGRYYILDWKSNHLGADFEDYTPEAIDAAMTDHRYHLQYQFYLVALDAHLRASIPDYDPARHLGGVYYLFVRGLDPQKTGFGVFRATAEPSVIADLAKALGQSET